VVLAGVVWTDEEGRRLLDLCRAASIGTSAVLMSEGRSTTVKTRFIAQAQQVLRVDSETAAPLAPAEERDLVARLAGERVAAVIVSDYAKGVVTDVVIAGAIELARRCEAPCVVDPKGARFGRYTGCTVITPNADEAEAARGLPARTDAESEVAGRALLGAVGCQAVVVTRGGLGVSLVTPQEAWHLPAQAREVFDVAGAGDTLVAVLTLAFAAGAALPAAVTLANAAAGLVVQARGVAVVTAEELGAALPAHEHGRSRTTGRRRAAR
jgi:D-beta-D-heptose 7-phosphate kinase/D-beta-D-heptose 1-phosphate adenosyltransferase